MSFFLKVVLFSLSSMPMLLFPKFGAGRSVADSVADRALKIMFWNVENYFDTFDNPETADDEFTPAGERHWSWKRFVVKRNSVAKTIIAAGAGNLPIIVALAEVENRFVLEQLVKNTPLARSGYSVIHRDSPDGRGIDVGLIYRKDRFKVLNTRYYRVDFENSRETTRLILYVKGVIDLLDTLHLFVNHWPSKLGGELKSFPKRSAAAGTLRMACDSVFSTNYKANIILTGDFNDTPDSKLFSLFDDFINLSLSYYSKGGGSIKFRGEWELIDLFFVSPNLVDRDEPIYCSERGVEYCNLPFLFEPDREYTGYKPKRVYNGPVYNGGVSDHLPAIIKIFK